MDEGKIIAGLYLAAGKSSRMGARKLDAEWTPGLLLGGAALTKLLSCGLEAVYAVVRPDDPLRWLPDGDEPEGGENARMGRSPLTIVPCEDAGKGMSYSIKCGLRAISEATASAPDAVLILLADQPFVDAGWLSRLIRLFGEKPDSDYAASASGDIIMPPALLSWRMCQAASDRLRGDRGMGGLFKSGDFAGQVLQDPESEQMLFDVDTPSDLEQARKRL